jgi:hypothetical protein
MTTIPRLFASLEGTWQFYRTISQNGTVQGFATFTKRDATTLFYREEGQWTHTEKTSYKVYREYLYALENDSIAVYFAEIPKRLFHILTFSLSQKALASHHCEADLYLTYYCFINPDKFTVTHTIEGPKKEMEITTQFIRQEAPCQV